MGLLKYGANTFNVENLPDGLVAISQNDFDRMRGVENSYLTLKAMIPVEVDHAKIGALLEKGQRYDSVNTELSTAKTQLSDAQTKIQGFSNLPQDFKVEKWQEYKNKEQSEIRQGKVSEFEKKFYERVEKEDGVKIKPIDKRFLPDLSNFDMAAPDAQAKFDDMYKNSFEEQSKFIKDLTGQSVNLTQSANQQPAQQQPAGLPTGLPSADSVSDTGMKVGRFADLLNR